jgi:hypothetical protein
MCFICDLVEAVKESEIVINQLTSERNDQTVWDPIIIWYGRFYCRSVWNSTDYSKENGPTDQPSWSSSW